MSKPNLRSLAARLERLIGGIVTFSGHLCAVLVILLMLVTVYDVTVRYLFQAGSVAVQEAEWHLFAAIFLLAAGATLREDGHVRVDMFYRSEVFGERGRRIIDIFGTLFFLLPFCALVIWASMPFVIDAWTHHEISPDPGGLSHRWAAKALIPSGFALLALQGIAHLLALLRRNDQAP